MNIKIIFNKILFTILPMLLLITYFFMFFTYKHSVISSAILESNMLAEALDSKLCPTYTLINNLDNIDINTINTFNISSPTNKLILISVSDQMSYIFRGSSNNWFLEKEFVCSTGLTGTETPKGIFSCGVSCCWLLSEKINSGAQYYININDYYYLHSSSFSSNKNTISEETIANPISHGCISLFVDDFNWIYDNVPDGSTIIIY